jgi:DNA-directed RNA polymerase specialized sigma24 family protein
MKAATPDPESASNRRNDEPTLNELWSALSEEQREVLALIDVEVMDYCKIGTVTNSAFGPVMPRLPHARDMLKSRSLQELEEGAHAVH